MLFGIFVCISSHFSRKSPSRTCSLSVPFFGQKGLWEHCKLTHTRCCCAVFMVISLETIKIGFDRDLNDLTRSHYELFERFCILMLIVRIFWKKTDNELDQNSKRHGPFQTFLLRYQGDQKPDTFAWFWKHFPVFEMKSNVIWRLQSTLKITFVRERTCLLFFKFCS